MRKWMWKGKNSKVKDRNLIHKGKMIGVISSSSSKIKHADA